MDHLCGSAAYWFPVVFGQWEALKAHWTERGEWGWDVTLWAPFLQGPSEPQLLSSSLVTQQPPPSMRRESQPRKHLEKEVTSLIVFRLLNISNVHWVFPNLPQVSDLKSKEKKCLYLSLCTLSSSSFFFFLVLPRCSQGLNSSTRSWPVPLQWKCRLLTAGLPGNSLYIPSIFKNLLESKSVDFSKQNKKTTYKLEENICK